MSTEIMITIGLGFFITIITTVMMARASRYWKGRDPFDGEEPLAETILVGIDEREEGTV